MAESSVNLLRPSFKTNHTPETKALFSMILSYLPLAKLFQF